MKTSNPLVNKLAFTVHSELTLKPEWELYLKRLCGKIFSVSKYLSAMCNTCSSTLRRPRQEDWKTLLNNSHCQEKKENKHKVLMQLSLGMCWILVTKSRHGHWMSDICRAGKGPPWGGPVSGVYDLCLVVIVVFQLNLMKFSGGQVFSKVQRNRLLPLL